MTRNGKPTAALVPIDEYDALEETAEILSDPDAIAALEAGLTELERGAVIEVPELRVGSCRSLYQLIDDARTVRVVAIRHRAAAYRSDPR